MVALKVDAANLDSLLTSMKAWLDNPVSHEEGCNAVNEMAILRTVSQGKKLLVAFGLGGSDNCTFAFL